MARRAGVYRFLLPDPGDVAGLRGAFDREDIDPRSIAAVIGKTHGNGLVNDYTRGYLTQSLSLLIGERSGETPAAVRHRVPFIFSGGVEGVLSPHYSVFTIDEASEAAGGPALAIGVASTPELTAGDIGRQRQIDVTAAAVRIAVDRASIASAAEVHFVQVKGPAFGSAAIAAAARAGAPAITDNPGKLMGYGRAASALAVGSALGETSATADDVLRNFAKFSSVASCSAGIEITTSEVVVLGMSREWCGPLAIDHSPMADALDVSGFGGLLAGLGLGTAPLTPAAAQRIRSAFVKCEASRDGLIRGKPHVMLNDGDIDQQRHIRAAVGAVVASQLNDTALFVSGGAEHQGPDGGGLVALVVEREG